MRYLGRKLVLRTVPIIAQSFYIILGQNKTETQNEMRAHQCLQKRLSTHYKKNILKSSEIQICYLTDWFGNLN